MNTKTTTQTTPAKTTKTTRTTKTPTTPKAKTTPTVKAPVMFATIGAMLVAHGLIPSGNCSSHRDNGRVTTGNFKSAELTPTGKAYFANRALELQGRLKDAMGKAGKAKAGFILDGIAFAFLPKDKAPQARLTHAPVNPGSYSAQPVRAWFALAVQYVQAK